jgi:hypothetical protein
MPLSKLQDVREEYGFLGCNAEPDVSEEHIVSTYRDNG